ncbi:MAG: hypothetical protein Q9196_007247 [Gyalolechia fulgens]
MKHMTCYFWHRGSCKHTEEACLYAHREFVPERVAGPPLQKEVGMPAVAGRNALREKSVYTDWTQVHANAAGLSVSARSQPTTSPILSQQIHDLELKHQSGQGGQREQGEQIRAVPGQDYIQLDKSEVSPPTNTVPDANMPSSPTQKVTKLETGSPNAGSDIHTPLDEETSENQAIKSAIPDLCQIIAILMKDQGRLMKGQAQAHEDLLKQVLTLPGEDQKRFQRPLVKSGNILAETAAASIQVTEMVDGIRKKLVDANLGSLLIPMDREYCTLATETSEE